MKTNEQYSDPVQAYAAGVVEGYLTADLLKKHWHNTVSDYCDGEAQYCYNLKKFLQTNLDFMNENIKFLRSYDVYWHQVFNYFKFMLFIECIKIMRIEFIHIKYFAVIQLQAVNLSIMILQK